MSIHAINLPAAPLPVAGTEAAREAKSVETAEGSASIHGMDFGHAFADALGGVRDLETKATTASTQFANGDPAMGIHEVMIATEKANLALRYTTTLKNKALEAYRELMNTQV